MEPNQQQNTRLSSMQSDIKAYLKAQVQEQVKHEEDNLRFLLQIGGASLGQSIEMSKGTLRVLYAFLQGDKHKCLAAINSVRNTFTEVLDGVMDANNTFVMSADMRTSEWTSQDYIGLNQSSDNARQVAANLKTKMDNFELLYKHME